MDERKNLIPDEDLEYERELVKKQEEADALEEQKQREAAEFRKNREKTLSKSKVELMKLKQGIIEESETVKEEEKVEYKQSFGEWLSNVWYRNKWLILFVVFLAVAFGYITYDTATRTQPDITVLVLSKNYALYYRTEELSAFLGNYCDDLNGDGEVYVEIYNISTDYSDTNTVTANQAQLMSQLQSGQNIILIADHATDFTLHDFTSEYDSDRFNELGLRLNCELTRDALKWEAMNDEVYIGMRQPQNLFSSKESVMQGQYDEALPMFERIVEAILGSAE